MENLSEFGASFSITRMRIWTVAISLIGASLIASSSDIGSVAGFLVGAVASWYNFLLLHRVVGRLGAEADAASRRVVTLFTLRYLGLGVLGYGTLILLGTNPATFCAGLLVAVFAMLFDATIELIYARA